MILLITWIAVSGILTSIAVYGVETNRKPAAILITFLLCSVWPLVLIAAVLALIGENKRVHKRPMK